MIKTKNRFAKKGLALKTFAFALVLMTLVMAVSLGILYAFLPSYYFRHKNNQLARNADILQQQLSTAASVEESAALIANFSEANNATAIAFDADNRLLTEFLSPVITLGPMAQELGLTTIHIAGEADAAVSQRVQLFTQHSPIPETVEGEGIRIMTGSAMFRQHITNVFMYRDISHPNISRIFITSTLQPIDEAQEVIISMLPYLFASGFVIALGLALFFARQLTKPILEISDTAALMREMKPDVVSKVASDDELGQLSQNLNKLYQDLFANMEGLQKEMEHTARLEQSKTDFMRAAGHELKTPIAALSGMLEGMIDGVGPYKNHDKYLPECKDQTRRLAKLVNEILVASEHVNDSLKFETVDVSRLIEEVLANYKTLIEKKQLHVNVVNSESFKYPADRQLLFNALSNLMSNAVNYTPEGGHIDIAIKDKVFSIENECPTIDASTLPKWFEPFYTPDYSRDKSKSGTGLGLYIVKKNLEALQLPVEVVATEMGIRFEVGFG
ncbi:MAG: HAMP domain-containing histidine kinase [Defluviitaleaceae bacterium]|nr:HAMP domain-containing histidine kinase [Defluviitaleaceae bacterium]